LTPKPRSQQIFGVRKKNNTSKDATWGLGISKNFCRVFPKKKNFSKKKKNNKNKTKKTYILPTPVPPQRTPLGVFGVKKVAVLGGGSLL
jgi:hypothetical protein